MLFKYILLGIFIYFMFRFLFDFIIPVVKTTKQVKKQFDAVREQQQQFNQQQQSQPSTKFTSTVDKDDYIEFEEVK
ncbi:MAG: hypothetical protein RL634_684 [Bacteroidota bacterium]|jgi:hypothetical protein